MAIMVGVPDRVGVARVHRLRQPPGGGSPGRGQRIGRSTMASCRSAPASRREVVVRAVPDGQLQAVAAAGGGDGFDLQLAEHHADDQRTGCHERRRIAYWRCFVLLRGSANWDGSNFSSSRSYSRAGEGSPTARLTAGAGRQAVAPAVRRSRTVWRKLNGSGVRIRSAPVDHQIVGFSFQCPRCPTARRRCGLILMAAVLPVLL